MESMGIGNEQMMNEDRERRMGPKMTIDEVKTIGVVGAGQMGRGIAQVLATAGWHVRLVDVADQALDEAITKIRQGIM